jgi:hypothetical protein
MEHLHGILTTLRESKLARWEWFDGPTDALQAASERSHAEVRSLQR